MKPTLRVSYSVIINVSRSRTTCVRGCQCDMLSLFCCIVLGAISSEDYVHCSDPQHSIAGAEYVGTRRLPKDILVCTHCHQCAFCRPRYDKCWAEGHLPPLHWKIVMDNMLKETHIMEVLTTKVLKKDLSKNTKMREAYRQHFCEVLPSLLQSRSSSSWAQRGPEVAGPPSARFA